MNSKKPNNYTSFFQQGVSSSSFKSRQHSITQSTSTLQIEDIFATEDEVVEGQSSRTTDYNMVKVSSIAQLNAAQQSQVSTEGLKPMIIKGATANESNKENQSLNRAMNSQRAHKKSQVMHQQKTFEATSNQAKRLQTPTHLPQSRKTGPKVSQNLKTSTSNLNSVGSRDSYCSFNTFQTMDKDSQQASKLQNYISQNNLKKLEKFKSFYCSNENQKIKKQDIKTPDKQFSTARNSVFQTMTSIPPRPPETYYTRPKTKCKEDQQSFAYQTMTSSRNYPDKNRNESTSKICLSQTMAKPFNLSRSNS